MQHFEASMEKMSETLAASSQKAIEHARKQKEAMVKKKDESIEKAHKAKFASLKPSKRAARAADVIGVEEGDGEKTKKSKKEEPDKGPTAEKFEKNPKLKIKHPDPKATGQQKLTAEAKKKLELAAKKEEDEKVATDAAV